MKYLKIENSKGEFFNGTQYFSLDKIAKEDLWYLAKESVTKNDFEMDEYDEAKIQNKAHQIIYQQIYSQLKSLYDRKDELKSQCDAIYKDAYDKYKM